MSDRLNYKSVKESMLSEIQSQKDLSMSVSDLERNNCEDSMKISAYTKCMKFRKSVIAILALNRLKGYRKGYFGKSLSTFKYFKDINFSNDSHYNEISRKIRLISIPDSMAEKSPQKHVLGIHQRREESGSLSPKNYRRLDAVSNMELTLNHEYDHHTVQDKIYTEGDYDTLQSISGKDAGSDFSDADETEKNLILVVDSVIEWQNKINKTRFQVTNKKKANRRNSNYKGGINISPNYNISDLYESLPELLASGLKPIKHYIKSLTDKSIIKTYLQSCMNYIDPLPYDTQYLLFVFLPNNYMAKG
jgi:hypothetical protein